MIGNIFLEASKNWDKEVCKKIIDDILQLQCNDRVVLQWAIDKKDVKQCNMIVDISMKQECEKIVWWL